MIENLVTRLHWCKNRRHWTESELERESLDEEIKILEIIIFADCFGERLIENPSIEEDL